MRVLVENLVANPYRKIDRYPIRQDKVESLKSSINDTGFWDNILARDLNGEIQIAYGHHRLQAIRELGIKEVDIPVKDLDDRTMIKIMANENMENWETNTSVINETMLTVYEFLMGPGVRKRERTGAVAEIKTFLGLSPLVTGAKLLPRPPPAV